MEEMEKILCMDKGNSALETAALMNNGCNGPAAMWNNPMMYLVWLALLGNGGFGWSDRNAGAPTELNGRFDSLLSQIDTNHNNDIAMSAINGNHNAIHELAGMFNTNYTAMSLAICGIKSAIELVSGQVGFSSERVINAVQSGDCGVIQAVKDCCCNTNQNITKMGYENQLHNCQQTNTLTNTMTLNNYQLLDRLRDLGNGISTGFSSVAYEMKSQTCDITQNNNTNTQRIIDILNSHWNSELQQKYADAKLELSQLNQNATLIAALKTA